MRAKPVLLEALDSKDTVVQQAAIGALGEIKAIDVIDQLLKFAASDDWLIRQRLAESLGKLRQKKGLSALKFLAKDEHPQVRQAAQLALSEWENT